MKRFPTIKKLAVADLDEVLAEWAGMGYYSRARNLHACAKQVIAEYGGQFPDDPALLEQLRGIGRSTAGAISAFAFLERAPILDANVKRILVRLFAIEGGVQEKVVNDRLWALASDLLPSNPVDMPVYTQALMDFGATWCTSRKPVCLGSEKRCPFIKDCQANLSDQVLLFPQKSKKLKSPEFDCNMLLMRSGNSVLLQKRSSKAIWGGLWSLPESLWVAKISGEATADFSLQELLVATLPAESVVVLTRVSQSVEKIDEIKHVFTHRRLWMHIWLVNSPEKFLFSNPDLQWVPLTQLGRYGLPQPIKLLLQRLSLVRDDDLKN